MRLRPSFSEVKTQYANPVPVGATGLSNAGPAPVPRPTYCVGGAFLRAVGESEETFPTPTLLGRALARYLGMSFGRHRTRLMCTAVNIILANDGGEVGESWRVLERAMRGELVDPCRCRFDAVCRALRRRSPRALPPAEAIDFAEALLAETEEPAEAPASGEVSPARYLAWLEKLTWLDRP
jgi:hypothetical protein